MAMTAVTKQVMTYAEAACLALREAMQADPTVVALGEDLGRGGVFGQYRGLAGEFGPERVIDTPISEANIMGCAVGMALSGVRPVVEMRVIDFALCAIDEIVNQAAKNRFMFGGQGRVPLVARMPIGIWSASAAQHSQSLEAWFAHIPGLVVVTPGTPADNYGLLKSAMACGDPVIYMEHKELWGLQGEVDTARAVPLGQGRKLADGNDLTIVTWSRGVGVCQEALDGGAFGAVKPDIIDLRTLWPWDREMVFESAARTGRLLVVHEAVQVAGFGAEIAASAAEHTGCKVKRLGAPRIPVGYAQVLENESRLSVGKLMTAIAEVPGK
jgi:acetoin:2,6-dichlorophenolindophenol oxidoreductase subunit beta